MSKVLDLVGTSLSSLRIGSRLVAGIKSLIFDNGFTTTINANPTANRVINLPDASGTVAFIPAIVAVSAAKTFSLVDAGTFQNCTNVSAITLTVPSDTTVDFPIGSEISINQDSTGQITINAASGTTIRRQGSTNTTGHIVVGQYSLVVLKKVAANEWRAYGGLSW